MVSADETLTIAEGRNLDIEFAVIDGQLSIREIVDKFQREQDGRPIIRVELREEKRFK